MGAVRNLEVTFRSLGGGEASRAFCVAAPTVWNSLDVHIRSADTFFDI